MKINNFLKQKQNLHKKFVKRDENNNRKLENVTGRAEQKSEFCFLRSKFKFTKIHFFKRRL